MPTDDEYVDRLRRILEVSRDPLLHDAIWSYREGKLDRMGLLAHPAFERHMVDTWHVAVEGLERQGGSLADVQAETQRTAREHGYDELISEVDK